MSACLFFFSKYLLPGSAGGKFFTGFLILYFLFASAAAAKDLNSPGTNLEEYLLVTFPVALSL
jgi:hypothetical protein